MERIMPEVIQKSVNDLSSLQIEPQQLQSFVLFGIDEFHPLYKKIRELLPEGSAINAPLGEVPGHFDFIKINPIKD